MDCEKCEELMLDELYGELDDVTSAMVRRHVQSCSRCNAMLSDLRGTREAVSAALVQEEAPASLEERIFAAEKEARKVVPIRSRTSTFISIAGRWAMRPQTAMAALFLLMIGSTTFLLKGRPHGATQSSAPITVAQEGAPVAAPNAASQDSLGPNAARNAHGPLETAYATPPPAAMPTAAASAASGTIAMADEATNVPKDLAKNEKGDNQDPFANAPPAKAMARAARPSAGADLDDSEDKKLAIGNAGMPGGAPAPASPPPPPAANAGPAPVTASLAGGGAGSGGAMAQQSAAEAANGYAGKLGNQGSRSTAGDDFGQGMAAYQARQFTPAMQSFDRAAQGGDLNASLWAARSVRDGQGCGAAVARYDSVSQRGGSSYIGADATLEGAQCYAQVGSIDVARAKYTQLLNVPSHQARAQAGLDSLNAVAARKSPPRAKAAQPPPQAAPPSQAPVQAKPATDNNNSANQSNGF